MHASFRRDTGRDAKQAKLPKRRQRAAVKRVGQSGAAGVSDLGEAEIELLEPCQHSSSRRRQCTCQRRRHHEGGDAIVAKRVALETKSLQRGQLPQGRREGRYPRVANGGVMQRVPHISHGQTGNRQPRRAAAGPPPPLSLANPGRRCRRFLRWFNSLFRRFVTLCFLEAKVLPRDVNPRQAGLLPVRLPLHYCYITVTLPLHYRDITVTLPLHGPTAFRLVGS